MAFGRIREQAVGRGGSSKRSLGWPAATASRVALGRDRGPIPLGLAVRAGEAILARNAAHMRDKPVVLTPEVQGLRSHRDPVRWKDRTDAPGAQTVPADRPPTAGPYRRHEPDDAGTSIGSHVRRTSAPRRITPPPIPASRRRFVPSVRPTATAATRRQHFDLTGNLRRTRLRQTRPPLAPQP